MILLTFNGCESQAERDTRIAKEAREELLAELKAKEEAEAKLLKEREANSTLLRMGISKNDDIITIDTNKTKNFFEQIAAQVAKEVKSFSKELKKGEIDHEAAGIEVNEKQIHIDLNKTENFLDKWGKKMQDFAKEFDAMTKELEINQPSKEYNATDRYEL